MNYGHLIRKARKYRQWTLQDLADELSYQGVEIDTGNLSRIETRKQGTSNLVLDGILRTFGISIEDLLLEAAGSSDGVVITPEKEGFCPVILWNQIAHWQDMQPSNRAAIAEDWLICPIPNRSDIYAVRVSGESMKDPQGPISFDDGDTVFFDPLESVRNNCFITIKESPETDVTFKQLIIENHKQYLKALNPDWPDRITPVKNDATIYGVAICKYRPCSTQEYPTRSADEDASQGR